MSVTVTYGATLTVVEVLSANVADLADKSITHSSYNTILSAQGSGSTPPVTGNSGGEIALIAGAKSIDLRALVAADAVLDGNGKRLQFLRLRNKSVNANPMTFAKGASNGYDGLGSAFSITLVPGAELLIRLNDGGNDIGDGNKTIDVTGTSAQIIEAELVIG